MRRNIWKEPSAELQKRLSSPGCLEYKHCIKEHEDWREERFSQGKFPDDEEYEQSWKKTDDGNQGVRVLEISSKANQWGQTRLIDR